MATVAGWAMTTSTDLVNALEKHYRGGPGHRDQDAWATWQELQDPSGRRVDYLALALWASRGRDLIGHEIKVSRADWLNELAQPSKAEQWWQACNRWYLVVPDPALVQEGELPPGWGLMVPPAGAKRSMKIVVEAPRKQVAVPHWLTVAMVKRDRSGQAQALYSAVNQAKYEAREEGYRQGKAALEAREGRILTREEKDRLELLERVDTALGRQLRSYPLLSERAISVTPEAAALALQVASAFRSLDGRGFGNLDQLLERIGKLVDAAQELSEARTAMDEFLSGSPRAAA